MAKHFKEPVKLLLLICSQPGLRGAPWLREPYKGRDDKEHLRAGHFFNKAGGEDAMSKQKLRPSDTRPG